MQSLSHIKVSPHQSLLSRPTWMDPCRRYSRSGTMLKLRALVMLSIPCCTAEEEEEAAPTGADGADNIADTWKIRTGVWLVMYYVQYCTCWVNRVNKKEEGKLPLLWLWLWLRGEGGPGKEEESADLLCPQQQTQCKRRESSLAAKRT